MRAYTITHSGFSTDSFDIDIVYGKHCSLLLQSFNKLMLLKQIKEALTLGEYIQSLNIC